SRAVGYRESAYRIGVASIPCLGSEHRGTAAAAGFHTGDVAAPGRRIPQRFEGRIENLRAAIDHGEQPDLPARFFYRGGGKKWSHTFAHAGLGSNTSVEVIARRGELRQEHRAAAGFQKPRFVA